MRDSRECPPLAAPPRPAASLYSTLACVLLLAPAAAAALEPLDLSGFSGSRPITPYVEVHRDPGGAAGVAEVAALGAGFASPGGRTNYGYTADAVWTRFRIANPGPGALRLVLEYAYPIIDFATLFSPREGGGWDELTLGDQVPFSRRLIRTRNPAFPLELPPGADRTYYVRAASSGTLEVPLAVWEPNAWSNADHDLQIVYGFFFGLVLIMGLYNFFTYLFTRDPAYLAYVLFTLGITLFVATIRGLSFEYFWPEAPAFANIAMPVTVGFADSGTTLFTMLFLSSRANLPRLHRVLVAFLVLSAALSLLAFVVPYAIITPAAVALTVALAALCIATGISGLVAGNRAARFYTAAWLALIGGVLLTALHAFGILQRSFLTAYGMELGSAAEIVLLSLSLADKLHLAQRESEEVQRRAYEEQKATALSFARFVPREFLEYLGKERVADVGLGDHTIRDMSVLFSDIRSFTTLSESLTPEENFNFINSYLSRIGPIVRECGGFIDKYIGDAIMALFPDPPDLALRAACEMQRALVVYNGHRRNSGFQPIRVGMGLHRGSLSLGTIGETGRMDTTVISDAVNIASRLESLTKRYDAQVIASGDFVAALVGPPAISRFLDRRLVKGKRRALVIHEVLETLDDPRREARGRNEAALRASSLRMRRGRWEEALRCLEAARDPELDPAPSLYRARCLRALGERRRRG